MKDTLFLIPARGGSKGIPGKNIKKLNGIPLLHYSIKLAREFTGDENICVSSDDKKIISSAKDLGLVIPFKRPAQLARDKSGSYEVILHALHWYKAKGIEFKKVVLLQPTSPLRRRSDLSSALKKYSNSVDMVVSASKPQHNPFSTFYKYKGEYITKFFPKNNSGSRRQDSKGIVQLNGAIYIFNVASLLKKPISKFKRIKVLEMPAKYSVDIDVDEDWIICETFLQKKIVKLDY